eukprot:1500428-Karenia_brevis.AAC.1
MILFFIKIGPIIFLGLLLAVLLAIVLQPEVLVQLVLVIVKALPQYFAFATHRMLQQFIVERKMLLGATTSSAPIAPFNHTAVSYSGNDDSIVYTASQWILGVCFAG